MATQPTNLPVPSESPRDLKFNAGKIDEFVTSFSQWYVDRFGVQHYTIEGLKQLVLQQIYNLGWNLKGTFQGGGTVTAAGDLLQDTTTLIWYRWDDLSTLPKNVPAGSTPSSTGGTGPGKWQPVDVADVLRKDLAKPSGAGLSGYDATVSYPANTVGAELNNRRKNMVFATADAGIPNDGSDVSTQVSTFLNANKGKFIVFDSGTYMFAGVVLSGTGWEGTTIYFKGKHLLKPDTTGTNTPGYGAFIGIVVSKDVNGLVLYYRGDGNRTLQYDREHIFNVAILGGTNIIVPNFECNEIRGDGCYVNLPDQNIASNYPTNIMFGNVCGKNTAQDGRNLISIVSCLGGSITNFRSENIGGTVGGVTQPGGLDIEPNANTQCLIRDFTVHNAEVINAGLVGIGFMSDPTLPPKIQNCHILNSVIRGTGAPRMFGTIGCSMKMDSIGLNNNGLLIEGAQNSKATLNINGCYNGVMIGTTTTCTNCTVEAFIGNIRNAGVLIAQAEYCKVNVTISGFSDSSGNNIGVWLRNLNEVASCIQRSNSYQVICPFPANVKKGMDLYTSTNAITFLGESVIRESIFTGFSGFTNVLGAAGRYLTKEGRIPGLTANLAGVPSDGTWKKGDFVFYSNPSSSNKFYGFYRITDGSGNVNGTDWGTVVFA